jgi:hypothetical protein
MSYVSSTEQVAVASDYDVVALRQHVRQQARAFGLGLIQQAKCATAATTIARSLLSQQQPTTFVTNSAAHHARPSLQITCRVPLRPVLNSAAQLEHVLRLDEIRKLVDDVDLALEEMTASVRLRIWLDTAAH